MSLPARAATYLSAGSSFFLVPVLAKMISCCSRSPLSDQNCWFICHSRLALTMPTMPWASLLSVGTFFSVYTSTRLTKML